jgi:putative lipoic acid-binding regulatory protein
MLSLSSDLVALYMLLLKLLSGTPTNSLFQRTVIWKVVQHFVPGKRKDRVSGEPTSSGAMWSFAAGSNLSTATSFKAEKESKKNLNKFYKELRTLKTVNMAGMSKN